MNKAQLIDAVRAAVASRHDLNKSAVGDVVDATFEAVLRSLKEDGKFQVTGFGTFTVKQRKARKGKNPKTGEAIEIAAHKTVTFKPSPTVKENL